MSGSVEMKTILKTLGQTDEEQHRLESFIVMAFTAITTAAVSIVILYAAFG